MTWGTVSTASSSSSSVVLSSVSDSGRTSAGWRWTLDACATCASRSEDEGISSVAEEPEVDPGERADTPDVFN